MRSIRRLAALLLCPALLGTLCAAVETTFSDVPEEAPYAKAVAWCAEHDLMNGVGGSCFDPVGTLDRATLATVLYRAEGGPSFAVAPDYTDIRAGQWYSDGVAWASEQGLLRGYGNNHFGPHDPVTKVQLDIVLRRYLGEDPAWPGDPSKEPAARADVAQALMERLADMLPAPASHPVAPPEGGDAEGGHVPEEPPVDGEMPPEEG